MHCWLDTYSFSHFVYYLKIKSIVVYKIKILAFVLKTGKLFKVLNTQTQLHLLSDEDEIKSFYAATNVKDKRSHGSLLGLLSVC